LNPLKLAVSISLENLKLPTYMATASMVMDAVD